MHQFLEQTVMTLDANVINGAFERLGDRCQVPQLRPFDPAVIHVVEETPRELNHNLGWYSVPEDRIFLNQPEFSLRAKVARSPVEELQAAVAQVVIHESSHRASHASLVDTKGLIQRTVSVRTGLRQELASALRWVGTLDLKHDWFMVLNEAVNERIAQGVYQEYAQSTGTPEWARRYGGALRGASGYAEKFFPVLDELIKSLAADNQVPPATVWEGFVDAALHGYDLMGKESKQWIEQSLSIPGGVHRLATLSALDDSIPKFLRDVQTHRYAEPVTKLTSERKLR